MGWTCQMPSAPRGPLKSLCCQVGQGVCRGPLSRPPSASSLGCLSWVRTPGEPAAWLPTSVPPSGSLLIKSVSLSLFSVLFFLFFLSTSIFLSLVLSFPPSYHQLSSSLISFYLSISFMPFLCISFLVSLIFFFSVSHVSLFPSFILHHCFFLCLSLNPESAAAQG